MALPLFLKFLAIQFFLLNNNVLGSLKSIESHKEKGDGDGDGGGGGVGSIRLTKVDKDLLEVSLNLEFLQAEFFLFATTGCGLDRHAPELVEGGPPPIGGRQVALLDSLTNDTIFQFGLQEIGHIRAIKRTVKGFPRPLLSLSCSHFAKVMDAAFGRTLDPPFDPYGSNLNFLLASYILPYVGLTGYVGASSWLTSQDAKMLVSSLLAVESGQDAVIRSMLYKSRFDTVHPYKMAVHEFANRISELRNKLGKMSSKDEGLVVEPNQGAEGKVMGNIIAGNKYSLAFSRSSEEMLRIIYASGDEKKMGGFFPQGALGDIALHYLKHNKKNKTID